MQYNMQYIGPAASELNQSSSCLQCAPSQGASSHRESRMRQHQRPPDLTTLECTTQAVRGFLLLARHHPNLPILCGCGRRAGRDPYSALNRRRGKRFRLRDTDRAEACSLRFSTTALGESVWIEPNFTVHREKKRHSGLRSESRCWTQFAGEVTSSSVKRCVTPLFVKWGILLATL